MPLIICMLFFIVLFCCEGYSSAVRKSENEAKLRRYQAVEHPRRTSDRYVDSL